MYINASNEKDLVMLLSRGNEAAFEELYYLYSNRLLGYLIRFVKSETIAAELLQETFIKIWSNRGNIDQQQSFRSYLFRIAENGVYDFFRKAARSKKLEMALVNGASEYSHVEESFFDKENEQLLQHAINLLPPKRRQIFQMIKIEERSYQEVSLLLGVSVSTINDHIVKATKSIRQNLERYHLSEISIIFFGLFLKFVL